MKREVIQPHSVRRTANITGSDAGVDPRTGESDMGRQQHPLMLKKSGLASGHSAIMDRQRPLDKTRLIRGTDMSSDEFRPPPIPEGLSPQQQQEFLIKHGIAHNLKHKTGASYLYAVAARIVGPDVSPESFVVYLDQLLAEGGHPTDPIERMLIEQIALAHHNIGRLYVRAASAETLDQVKVYNAAAANLLAEFRRAALALKKYREPTPPKNFMLVKQQNIAQNQQVGFLDNESGAEEQTSNIPLLSERPVDSKLVSKGAIEYAPQENVIPQPQSCRGRKGELVKAKRTQR